MCGIFGFTKPQGDLSEGQMRLLRKSFTHVAKEASVRGEDSTGVALVGTSGTNIYKTLMSSKKAIHTKEWAEVLESINGDTTTVIGHTRYATTGTVNVRNAHPFRYKQIVGAHNGVIYNWDIIKGHKDSMEVDSEVIFSRLSKKQYKTALEGLEGYFALSWVDENPHDLYLARDEDGPIQVAYWRKARVLFWASTEDILKSGLDKAGLNLKTWSLKDGKIYQYHTQAFSNKLKFDTQDLDLPKSFSFDRKYSGYTYSGVYGNDLGDFPCIYCGVFTSSDSGACKECDSMYVAECDMCQKEKLLKELKLDREGYNYLCDKCFQLDADQRLFECCYCGDWFDKKDLTGTAFRICHWCNSGLKGVRYGNL
jgi:predicted glutamine amidotransferase